MTNPKIVCGNKRYYDYLRGRMGAYLRSISVDIEYATTYGNTIMVIHDGKPLLSMSGNVTTCSSASAWNMIINKICKVWHDIAKAGTAPTPDNTKPAPNPAPDKVPAPVRPREVYDLSACRQRVEKTSRVISKDEAIKAIQSIGDLNHKLHIKTIDERYRVVPWDVWDNVIAEDDVDSVKYVSDQFDCDDFAKIFTGVIARKYRLNAIGWVLDYSGKHAYNVIVGIDDNGGISARWFEPQSDRYVRMGESAQYVGERGEIII